MRTLCRNIFYVLVAVAAMLVLSGCIERIESFEEDNYKPTSYLSFKASINVDAKSLITRGAVGSYDFEEEDWDINFMDETSTKTVLYSSLDSIKAGVFGYVYNGEWNKETQPLNYIKDDEYFVDGDIMSADTPIKWSLIEQSARELSAEEENSKLRIYAYAPKDAITPEYQGDSQQGAPVLHVPDVFSKSGDEFLNQKDILVAHKDIELNVDKSHRKEVPLDFEHIYTAIRFTNGFEDATINSVKLTGIAVGGKYVLGEGWTETDYEYLDADKCVELSVSNDYRFVIPQEMESERDPKITVIYTDDKGEKEVSVDISGVEWRQGKRITYTLRKNQKYIYLDLAAVEESASSHKVTTINGKEYVGYVYVKGKIQKITGTLEPGQEYYIYQSCITKANKSSNNYKDKIGWTGYDEVTHQGTGQFTLPSYPRVTYNGQSWSDYITNNTDVEAVIQAWDNAAGAGEATEKYISFSKLNGDGAAGAVRDAGREATKNRIHITGNIGDVRMTIDNIYSSFQQRGSTPVRTRTQAGISFLPAQDRISNSTLTINIVGDNRLGCVNYQNYNDSTKNWLKFEGSGSLTVGDTDYWRDDKGWGSNRSCSVIGGKDEEESEEDVYNIEFNGGVIYAGATTSACTAIGGGGNGNTRIVINGGTITAVARTTGTAIGGGSGLVQPGGEGEITINDGNVYAYNFENSSYIPSSAIGAAGSQTAKGGVGTVKINGGYVYAFSEKGTAIGGGSSAERHGGKGVINISGGTVIAKTGDPESAGIGGGSSYTDEYNPLKPSDPKNGGDAEVTITGAPIIRTGSIGGGTPGKGEGEGGKIGSAKIKITGGDIQAQFVMANSLDNKFEMKGGVIRNSVTSDDEYFCIQPNGGAVYMEKGSFKMTGGTIKDCIADGVSDAKGGAVYLKGDMATTKFVMTGGTITRCRAATHGGAVYLESGSIEINGGTIEGNVAEKGNGGAISIWGGHFKMDGEDASIFQNAAFNTSDGVYGNGGGIYITPLQDSDDAIEVKLQKGKIMYNSADRNGGGICVDMGGNSDSELSVDVGVDGAFMFVNENNAQIKGGGMYVYGGPSTVVTLYDGEILSNATSSYRINQDVIVEGGVINLKKSGITTQVAITFNNNHQYYPQGGEDTIIGPQYVVKDSSSKLNDNEFSAPNNYYKFFKGWNTRRDGKGTSYSDGQISSFNDDIMLFAQWSNEE